MTGYCHQCGEALPVSAKFCSKCGSAVAPLGGMAARPLLRPRQGRVIGGVCAALARAYGWDPVLVRVLTVGLVFISSGIAGIGYIACWVGIPEEPWPAQPFPAQPGYPPTGYPPNG